MSGYSWMNSFTPTHFGKSALEGGRNYTKNEQQKRNREMKFLNDQKMLEKLTLEVANLPAQQEQGLRLGEAQIGQSLAATEASQAATDYQQLVTAIEKDFGRAQRQAGINAQKAATAASYSSIDTNKLNQEKAQYEIDALDYEKRLRENMNSIQNNSQIEQMPINESSKNKETAPFWESVLPSEKTEEMKRNELISERMQTRGMDKNQKESFYKSKDRENAAFIDQWKEKDIAMGPALEQAKMVKDNVSLATKARNELGFLEQGPFRGNLKAVTDAAGSFDRAASSVVMEKMDQIVGSASNQDVDRLEKSVFTREQPEGSFRETAKFLDLMADRTIERASFNEAAKGRGLSPSQADVLWSKVVNEKPIIKLIADFDNKKSTGTSERGADLSAIPSGRISGEGPLGILRSSRQ